jgi:hypothetical protein
LFGRGIVRLAQGDKSGAQDVDTATAMRSTVARELAGRGLKRPD